MYKLLNKSNSNTSVYGSKDLCSILFFHLIFFLPVNYYSCTTTRRREGAVPITKNTIFFDFFFSRKSLINRGYSSFYLIVVSDVDVFSLPSILLKSLLSHYLNNQLFLEFPFFSSGLESHQMLLKYIKFP